MRKIIIFYIFIAFNPYSGFAQKTRKVDVFMVYAITDSDSTTKIRFITLIPNDIENKQKINDIYFSVQPDTVFFRGNNKYAEFNLMKPIPESIEIISNITTFNNDYKTVAQGSPILDTTDLSRYLKSERWIDSEHPEILERAQKLMGKNELSTVKNIYNFVKKNIKYGGYILEAQGSLLTLKTRKGDCTDYSHLMVALCRASSIPARSISGLTATWRTTPKHEWVEVYFDGLGWVVFEPTQGHYANFNVMENKYVSISPSGHDPDVMGEYFYWRYTYWGKKPEIEELFYSRFSR